MSESEWLSSNDPSAMLQWLTCRAGWVPSERPRRLASDRKLRLFACACCRAVWPLFADARCLRAIEVAEQFADGLATEEDRSAAWGFSEQAYLGSPAAADNLYWLPCICLAFDIVATVGQFRYSKRITVETQAALLREIFDNPWQPTLKPESIVLEELQSWRDGAIPKLAAAMYDGRDFADMPILGDMLQEAGCEDAAILEHCRKQRCPYQHMPNDYCDGVGIPVLHVRGCWAIDILLGRM